MKFRVDKGKVIEALLYIECQGAIARASSILYIADRQHLRTYGRPVTGDSYTSTDYGPAPAYATEALAGLPLRQADLSHFSRSDLRCLDEAIECRNESIIGEPYDFDSMLEGADPAIVVEAETFAAYGVL